MQDFDCAFFLQYYACKCAIVKVSTVAELLLSSTNLISVDASFLPFSFDQAPDVKAEIERQLCEGAWNSGSKTSDSHLVREFTAGAGQAVPDRPCVMSVEEVKFLGKMMLDEIMEMFATVLPPFDAKEALKGFIDDRFERS